MSWLTDRFNGIPTTPNYNKIEAAPPSEERAAHPWHCTAALRVVSRLPR